MCEKKTEEMYIHKMGYEVRKRLVDVLDAGDFWRELGGRQLNYSYEVKSNRIIFSKWSYSRA